MVERNVCYEFFSCKRVGKNVRVTCVKAVRRNSETGEVDQSYSATFDCEHKMDCRVVVSAIPVPVCDWTKCLHPELKH